MAVPPAIQENGYLHNLTSAQQQALEETKQKYAQWLKENDLVLPLFPSLFCKKSSLQENYDIQWRSLWNESETNDYLLLRFLRARGFNVDVATKLLYDCISKSNTRLHEACGVVYLYNVQSGDESFKELGLTILRKKQFNLN
jgi:hypothetical protein